MNLRNRAYYDLKPLIPRPTRLALRSWLARRKRPEVSGRWPILPGSEQSPDRWPGWPDGKKFAFVLTHDVESQQGLDGCIAVAELEMELGFHSCFNFIPESGYTVPSALRAYLAKNGFEIGVHDFHHDGKLFRSRKHFLRQAPHINRYVQEWGAAGFRSGFMLRQLDWLHDLDVEYDASTFDTDPFEPQSDGVGTIFPFWVPRPGLAESEISRPPTSDLRPASDGYVELPYTLPQDSTLFFLLREKHPDIWMQKLDWVAERGGMALVNVHPDYMQFKGDSSPQPTYSSELYVRFLEYARRRYGTAFWQPLPRDVARLVRAQHLARESQDNQTARGGATYPTTDRQKTARPSKCKIWIDLDNTPHVPFFEPIIDELHARGYSLLVTARDAFQVCDLADKKRLSYLKVGRHHGKHRLLKAAGLVARAVQLGPVVVSAKPWLAVSHGARSQLLLSNWLRIPSLLIEDYEYSQFPAGMRPTWVMAPEVIPDEALGCRNGRVRKYSGIKEDVYAWKLAPDPTVLRALGIAESDVLATVRPPATEAHYHNPESETLFNAFMERACVASNLKVVLLPRNQRQASFLKERWPHWFSSGKTLIPAAALDGMNLIWYSDLVVSGGGTMNREAAALGVPVYSIFRGTIGAVDRQLCADGRLILIKSVQEVETRIDLAKRPERSLQETTSRTTLLQIVDGIEEIAAMTTGARRSVARH